MALLSRILGRKAPEAQAPQSNTVVIDSELAGSLTAEGLPLEAAVNGALREYVAAKAKAAETAEADAEARGIPFWLRRDSERSGDIEDQLRDRVIGRRSSEESGG